jgi:hypothetical protein
MAILHHTEDPVCPLCEEKLRTACGYMAKWFREKKAKYRNLHVSWAYRGPEEQEKAFQQGASSVHYPHSKHNYTVDGDPFSLALDVFQITEDGEAVFSHKFCELLHKENLEAKLPIRWGGTFKLKKGSDGTHFEYTGPV